MEEYIEKNGNSTDSDSFSVDNELIVTLSDNTSLNGGTIKAIKGDPGFSPKITANEDNTDTVYRLDIETEEGTLTTPNLMQGSVPIIEF